jgi:glycosyltransferase involved in cell wall biosynthesis
MKVAIFIDALINMGGVERLVLEQAKLFNADIYVGRFWKQATFPEFKKCKIIALTKTPGTGFKTLKDKLFTISLWLNFSRLKLKRYDLFIIHGSAALNAAKNNRPNIWYCHSPSRYLYDLYQEEYSKQVGLGKIVYPLVTGLLRKKDQKNVNYVDKILVNSKNVQVRVKKYYNKDSSVVYPFVDIKRYKFIKSGDFYLSSCRLDKIKRVGLAVKAFLKMPDKKLVVASDGPEKEKLFALADGAKNITFLGYVSEEELRELYGDCIATIYLSYKEDFGIVPIESMSAGKPCIATNDGGFKETVLHKQTGYLVDRPESVEEVIAAVKYINRARAVKMRKMCENRAASFGLDVFRKKMLKEARELVN